VLNLEDALLLIQENCGPSFLDTVVNGLRNGFDLEVEVMLEKYGVVCCSSLQSCG
jgi:hypothetical protein